MANNNDILFNAAINGFVKAQLQGRGPASSNADDYGMVVANAAALAKTVDLSIYNNSAFPNENGTALAPISSLIRGNAVGQILGDGERDVCIFFAGTQSATSSLSEQLRRASRSREGHLYANAYSACHVSAIPPITLHLKDRGA